VMGASIISITALISKEFVRLVVFAIILASPVAFYIVKNWLHSFNYRVPISVSIFLITAGTAILIALLTVSFQAIKAALANPVKSLRSE
jgi:putative ABC transport system permease protein